MSETLPDLIRRSDHERFAITIQARSPTGPVTLRQVRPPHAIVNTTNDRLRADFFDPKDSGSPPLVPLPEVETGAPLYLSADGYTLLARDGKGAFHPVGTVTERTADGFIARLHGDLKSVSITGKIVS